MDGEKVKKEGAGPAKRKFKPKASAKKRLVRQSEAAGADAGAAGDGAKRDGKAGASAASGGRGGGRWSSDRAASGR